MKKVVLFTSQFPNPIDETKGIFKLYIAKNLKKYCDIIVINPLPYFPNFQQLRKFKKWYDLSKIPYNFEIDGIHVYSPKYIMIPKVSEQFHALLMFFAVFPLLLSLKKKKLVDIVNSHWLYPDGACASLACSILKIHHIPTGMGCDVNHAMYLPLIKEQILKSLHNSQLVSSVSTDLSLKISNAGIPSRKIRTIPNGVDLLTFIPKNKFKCRKNLLLPLEKKIIIFVGRLSREKGVDILIEAASKIPNDNFLVLIIGDGPLKKTYLQLLKNKNLDKNFRFFGIKPHNEIVEWIGASDLLCLPSRREGCPNVVLESLASGCPVVATDTGGIPDLIQDGDNGFLFQKNNADDLSICLQKGLKKVWDSEYIRKTVLHRSWGKVSYNYYKLYQEVLCGGVNKLDNLENS